MIDHLSIGVSDLAKSREFYQEALTPLGYQVKIEMPHGVCFSAESGGDLWIVKGDVSPIHLAFGGSRQQVEAFYTAALKAGGVDNGGPGLRPQYHENYYAAFIFDPDGYNLEVVSHAAS